MNWKYTLLSLLLFVTVSYAAWGSSYYGGQGNDAVLLENIRVLTLERGKYTNARRVSAIPQLSCIGGNARGSKFEPSVVQCENMGSDGYDIQWKCTADLDNSVKFGKTEVVCEGYNSPDDNYILRGSCGLEYTLEYTNAGNQNSYYNNYNNYDSYRSTTSSSWGFGTWVLFAMAIFIAWNIMKQCTRNASQGAGYNGGNGGNYGGNFGGSNNNNDGNDYPPSGGSGGYGGYPKTNSYGSSSSYVPPPTSSYTPGFWSGLGGGSLLGYLFGSRSRPSYYGSGYGSNYYGSGYNSGYGSSWGSRPSSFGSGGFGSSGSRSSSGFGGTRRR